ncbi:ATP-dependent DNA helicase RecG [Rothia sp. HMSC065B04]|uniref:ATP-dependent DNA helicase RecG n=1 Tax=Rothia sp. HMSC065B04 TaxID=1739349 RepID=UPI0009F4082B|nr:helicase-related protein [Rothia sp. HMSC065B04]
MSPARRSVNPQQEALDLGLPEPAPAKTKPAKAEAAQGEPAESTAVEPTRAQRGKKATLLLSDEQLRTTAELTVRDLAAYARGEVSRAELSERAAQRASAPYRKALKTLKHSLGPAAHTMTDDALYELVDIALAARQATQPEEPARKKATRRAPAQKAPVQKKTVQKEPAQNEPSPQENENPARATSARPQKVTKASEGIEQKPAPKKSVPEVEAEKPAPKKAVAKKTAPAEKAPASKAAASKTPASKTATPKTPSKKATPAQKTTPKKAPAQKAPAKKAATKKVAAEKPAAASASAAAEAKSRALARYASEDRLENAPLKKYLPAPSAKAISAHLDLHTVGEMLEYFPRKYLPRGELSSFAELVEGQDVTIIARVVHVSTRTMAARRGKITEVTITDRLADATGQDAPAGFGVAGFGAGGPVSVVPGRANRPGSSAAPAQSWQATGMHNPRINALANSRQNPAAQIPRAQNPAQGRGAQPASYSGYADSYGQDSFAQDSFAQDSFAQGGLFGVPAPSMTNPGALIGSQMKLSFFNAWTAAREIHEGETMMFSGRVDIYRGEYTLTNPHYALLSKDASGADITDAATAPVPVYRAPVKLPTDRISGYMAQLLEKVPLKELEDPVPYTIRRARKVPSLEWTYRALHTPDSEDTWRAAQAQMRYREAFVLQSALARLHSARAAHLTQPRPAVEGGLADQLLQVLPYELTEGQQKVGAEIAADLSSESPMNRLLQGDVGSGKTVVALRAMLQVADAGGQSAMLAPTEVLAEQHLRSVLDILGDMAAPEDSDDSAAGSAEETPSRSGDEPRRVRVRLLTASMGTRAKRKVLQELADGTAQIVIGTHALLSDEVSFHDLGLVVVDEQHRFGVEQRDGLRGTDGVLPHRLVMTATPIPRTVAMTVFGDLDVSVLDTLPAGRQKISTHVVPLAEKPAWASRLWRRAREEIDAGHQVYVVVPKIGEDGDGMEEGAAFFGASSLNGAGAGAGNSAQGYFGQGGSASSDGKVQLTSVASMYSYLSAEDALVGVRIGTLHGRMDPAEKTAVMTAFERGEIDLLISTTVIEVGVNVPNATLMIIMDADRFGISGLHQLRGRVGRGGYAGTCLLVTRQEEGGVSRERLDAVASTTDGFELSRIDLAQRREGDILGAAQSGSKSTLRFLRALADADIIERAREDARSVVEKDPTLAKHPSLARTIDRALDADREAFLGRG